MPHRTATFFEIRPYYLASVGSRITWVVLASQLIVGALQQIVRSWPTTVRPSEMSVPARDRTSGTRTTRRPSTTAITAEMSPQRQLPSATETMRSSRIFTSATMLRTNARAPQRAWEQGELASGNKLEYYTHDEDVRDELSADLNIAGNAETDESLDLDSRVSDDRDHRGEDGLNLVLRRSFLRQTVYLRKIRNLLGGTNRITY